ncbi:Transcriptional regulator, GntR-family [Cupriavidus necator]|uniref:GntR family transcriptional regulator n=1 Tax=Cupriavidus necator (strain ATCC 17699 / DSM 428 / KCTC 22496 / NCIMB 10442 / H16 / Stanier 337) TaxID=381666 RepID=Q0KBF1_CUPNH|nr:GntR family transcriptional regulator [Cupriavidus necator]QCC00547.1 GntR family transcriptional regulator [Cupriavidus necator H16]QQB76634.1 GntR family transcriptional regulator [Cupriavidus necator]WKA42411.1 GntR family transcriptional regulator [Cupriavidus necator]CAJ92670.1 transcriptional regulator, GntR-family [Cupriavidus necator H16]
MGNQNSPMPRYHRIYLVLRQKILNGLYDESGLPAEFRLMEQYRVARVTVRRALAELLQEGLIYRRPGQGTFVNIEQVRLNRPPAQMCGLLDSLLEVVAGTSVRVVDFGMRSCPTHVREALRLAERDEALHVMRVRLHRDEPVSLITTWSPPHVALLLTPGALQQQPMLALLEDGGVRIGHADQTLSCCLADAQAAALLDEPVGAALLSVVRVVRDVDGNPVQWLSGLYRPQCYDYRMALTRAGEDKARIWLARDLSTATR